MLHANYLYPGLTEPFKNLTNSLEYWETSIVLDMYFFYKYKTNQLMKSKILILLTLFFGSFALQAQEAKDLLKTANKALTAYNLDPAGNSDKLSEAKQAIDQAFDVADLSSDYKANLTRSKINTEIVGNDYKMVLLNPETKPSSIEAGADALAAIETAIALSEKKYEMKQVLAVLSELAPYLSVIGNQFIGLKEYASAYEPLTSVIKADELLKTNGEKSVFENEEDLGNHKYVTAVCATRAEKNEEAKALLTELYEAESKEPGVYSTLYTLTINEDEEKAMKVLAKGKEIDPGNTELLFAEINYYIKQQKFDVLEEKLKMAIEKDPENPSVYSALGNVYMNLSETAASEGDEEKSAEYFESSLNYYNQTLELDPKSFDAQYSIGSLYFNKAAGVTKAMQDLGLSKEDQMKYTELEKKTKELFTKALPYFVSAEKLNPSDMNTLIALKEIFARQDDFEKSNEFKSRLESVQAGETIESSYFDK